MKICTGCRLGKPENEFFIQDKASGRRHAECKQCYSEHRRSYYHEHYLKYGEIYRERAKVRRARIKKELQARMLAYLSDKSCAKCGENDPCVLDFDHLDPRKKSFDIARAITYGFDWERIMTEISKCQVLCANCHRRQTAAQNNWYRLQA